MSSNILNAWLVEDVSCLVHIDYPSSCPRFMCMHVNCTLFTFWIWYICPLFLQAESLTMCCCLLCFDLDLTHVRTWKTSEVNFKKQVLTICKLNTLDIILLVFFLNSCKAYANWCHPTLVRLPCCVNFKFSNFEREMFLLRLSRYSVVQISSSMALVLVHSAMWLEFISHIL